jgi:hypothetical protein
MQTLSLFDEFPESMGEITDERKHQKRMRLEPLIYDILKLKYLPRLCEAYDAYEVPKNMDKCIVIVERRIHENLFFLLRNITYFAKGWSVCIVCSDVNMEYCKNIAGNNVNNIQFLPLFTGNPEPAVGKKEYNDLLKNADFYRKLNSENLLFVQTDTYLRKPIPDIILSYDYAASPYAWDENLSGGGISFRKRSPMVDICEKMTSNQCDEDVYICNGVRELGYKMPEFMEGITYFSESCLYEDPIGVHQWWTFFMKEMEDAEVIFDSLLTLEI